MVPTARRAHAKWAATRITAFIGLVFRMLWSVVAAGLKFLVFLVTPLTQLRKAAHFVQTTASRLTSSTPITDGTTNDWATSRVTALSEMWALVALRLGFVLGAWRLMLVCKAARVGARDFLNTLPGLVVCGRRPATRDIVNDVWRLDLATLQWEAILALGVARTNTACCVVRNSLIVIGGRISSDAVTGSVEMVAKGGVAVTNQPPMSCDGIGGASAVAVDDSDSAAGEVLLLGGFDKDDTVLSSVYRVDLATSVCKPQPNLLHTRGQFAAVRLPDGRIVCAGGFDDTIRLSSVEVFEQPAQGALDTAWIWREVPAMSVASSACNGCVLSDGRFAVLGGMVNNHEPLSACEALLVGEDAHWEILPSMHEARSCFSCAALARCIVVADGYRGRTPLGRLVYLRSAEVFDEVSDRWLQLPCDLPHSVGMNAMNSALL
jgi:hypothetical protein